MSLQIGTTTLRYGLMLAPMAGVTDRAFRKICRRHG
ncbi:MAG: tRNA dihydrouridine synthase DusB, partial [Ruminococcaceae bacterium]|nr:tRNA dihydrouridine synthase DusB [Oscillospiraceae bacterium]